MREISTAVWHESLRWLKGVLSSSRRHPGHAVVLLALCWLTAPLLPIWALVAVLGSMLAGLVWSAMHPLSFHQLAVGPAMRIWRHTWFRRHWADVAAACGLGRERRRLARRELERSLEVDVPRLSRVRTDGPRVLMQIRPLMGQTLEDFESAAERLRTAVGASRIRVEPYKTNQVLLTFTIGDTLAEPFTAALPQGRTPYFPDPSPHGPTRGRVELASARRTAHSRRR